MMTTMSTMTMGTEHPASSIQLPTSNGAQIPAHNAYHALIVRVSDMAAIYGALCGLELLAHKDVLAHGDWGPWVEEHCDFAIRTASNYVQAAERASEYVAGVLLERQGAGVQVFRSDVILFLQRMLDAELNHPDLAALLEAVRKAKPADLTPVKPKAIRAPRGPLPPEQVALRYVGNLRKAPEAVRHVIFSELRGDFEAWMVSHASAAQKPPLMVAEYGKPARLATAEENSTYLEK